jgi:hypothetical protein
MSIDTIIPENAPAGKQLTLADLTSMTSLDLYRLGLTDAHIAALDAADARTRAARAYSAFERRQLGGIATRATERAQGVTLADVAAVLGYTPVESESR